MEPSKRFTNRLNLLLKKPKSCVVKLGDIQEAMENVSSFQEFFNFPKARGEWREASLEHILKEYFPSDFYQSQYMFESGEQVDAILKLPNDKLLPIDSKFPFDNYKKMVEEEKAQKEVFKRHKEKDYRYSK